MSTKPFMLVVAAALVVAGAWVFAGPSTAPSQTTSATQAFEPVDPAELDRLIDDFTSRYTLFGGVTNGTTLGQLLLERSRLSGDVVDYASAQQVLDETYRSASTSVDTALALASANAGLHRFGEAYELASDALALEPGRLDAIAVRGDAALALGLYDEARSAVDTLVGALGPDPAVLVRSAAVAGLDGDPDRALSLVWDAVGIVTDGRRPLSEQAFYLASHGALALESGRLDLAIDSFEQALGLVEDYAPALEGRGIALAHMRQYDRAVADLTLVTELSEDLHAHLILGDILTLAGRPLDAAAEYEKAYEIDDPFGLFVRPVASHLLTVGDAEGAQALAEQELTLRRDVGALDLAAWAAFHDGDLERARSLSDEAVGLASPSGLVLYHAGAISIALGDLDRAEAELRRALQNPYFDLLAGPAATEMLAELDR